MGIPIGPTSLSSVNVFQQRQGMLQLTNAINSSDIDKASQIFKTLFSNTPAVTIPNTSLYNLSQALQSGDALQAQLALINLRSSQQEQQVKINPTTLPTVGNIINIVV